MLIISSPCVGYQAQINPDGMISSIEKLCSLLVMLPGLLNYSFSQFNLHWHNYHVVKVQVTSTVFFVPDRDFLVRCSFSSIMVNVYVLAVLLDKTGINKVTKNRELLKRRWLNSTIHVLGVLSITTFSVYS